MRPGSERSGSQILTKRKRNSWLIAQGFKEKTPEGRHPTSAMFLHYVPAQVLQTKHIQGPSWLRSVEILWARTSYEHVEEPVWDVRGYSQTQTLLMWSEKVMVESIIQKIRKVSCVSLRALHAIPSSRTAGRWTRNRMVEFHGICKWISWERCPKAKEF